MIDRIAHHADVINLKGTSYRLKHHYPTATTAQQTTRQRACLQLAEVGSFSVGMNVNSWTHIEGAGEAMQGGGAVGPDEADLAQWDRRVPGGQRIREHYF